MKYGLRSLMIAVMVLPPLLAWGWWCWQRLHERNVWLVCPDDDFSDDSSGDPFYYAAPGGRMNFPPKP